MLALLLSASLLTAADTLPTFRAMPPDSVYVDDLVRNLSPAADFRAALGPPDSTWRHLDEVRGDTMTLQAYGALLLVGYGSDGPLALERTRFGEAAPGASHSVSYAGHVIDERTRLATFSEVCPRCVTRSYTLGPGNVADDGGPLLAVPVALSSTVDIDDYYVLIFDGERLVEFSYLAYP